MFDDVLDVIDVLLAADTYDHFGKPILRGVELVKNAGAGAIAKGSGPVGWGLRGADYVVNDLNAIDLPPGVREQLRAEAAQAKSGAFTGDVISAGDGDQVRAGEAASDTGARSPSGDQVITGVFDP